MDQQFIDESRKPSRLDDQENRKNFSSEHTGKIIKT